MNALPDYRRAEFVRTTVLEFHFKFREASSKMATQAVLLEDAHQVLKWRHQAVLKLVSGITISTWFSRYFPLQALSETLRGKVDSGVLPPNAGVWFAKLPHEDQERFFREFMDLHAGRKSLSATIAKKFLAGRVPRFLPEYLEWKRGLGNRSYAGVEYLDTTAAVLLVGGIPELGFLLGNGKPPERRSAPEAPSFQAYQNGVNPLLSGLQELRNRAKHLIDDTQFATFTRLSEDALGSHEALTALKETVDNLSALNNLLVRTIERKAGH